ncbi:MAG: acyl-CoA dehydrogenase family protein, partial [Desulfobacterales bacterium]|nr:acyl-CoA dehydrogenase family protein [Desulfobacterales bacterium]
MTTSPNYTLVADAAERLFADFADPQRITSAADDSWQSPLWQALEDNGMTLAWLPESLGGAGMGLGEGFALLQSAGRYAVAVPLAESLLAAWLLGAAGIPAPAGPMAVAPMRPDDRVALTSDGTLRGIARRVRFAHSVQHIVVLAHGADGATVALVRAQDVRLRSRNGLSGDLLADVTFDGVRPLASARSDVPDIAVQLSFMGATVRSLQIAGALQSMLARSVEYAGDRIAFGKPIAKFQAVQHMLAILAAESAAATAAATSAADSLASGTQVTDGVFLEVAAAKIRCGEAAEKGCALA